MTSGKNSVLVRRLQQALGQQRVAPFDAAHLGQIVDDWNRLILSSVLLEPEKADDPLRVLGIALSHHGIRLEEQGLFRVAWALLGVPATGRVQLGEARWSRLTHLTELHDVTLPSGARTLARQLAHEEHLVPDLLHARPWLGETGHARAEDILAAIFQSEWTGFLALLGEFGPWVYVPSVADLQVLSRLYARLVHSAAESREAEVLAAVLESRFHEESLLLRLEVTDYRSPDGQQEPLSRVGQNSHLLLDAEGAFWEAAEGQAHRQRAKWVARRR